MAQEIARSTIKGMEEEIVNLFREKTAKFTEVILKLLNDQLVLKGDSDIISYNVPSTSFKITYNTQNDGYGIKVSDDKFYAFVSPSELSIEEGSQGPFDEIAITMAAIDIRNVLELLKNTSEALDEYVKIRQQELQEKIDTLNKF